MSRTADEIAQYLADNAIGTQATDLFVGSLPATPGDAIAVLESGGLPPEGSFGAATASLFERPRIQIIVRWSDYEAARNKIEAIFKLLEKVSHTSLGTTRYLRIAAVQSPMFIGRDGTDRFLLSCNFQITKELSAA